jgi:hypothetical protein
MNRATALWALVGYTASRLLSPGRLRATLSIFAFPVVAAAGFSFVTPNADLLAGTIWVYLNLYVTLVAASLYNALGVTAQEFEDGTAVYVYSGVLPRYAVFLARYVVVTAMLSLFSAVSVLATYLALQSQGARLGLEDALAMAGIGASGVAAYTAVYMACGVCFRHGMAACLVFTMIWEVVVFATPTQLWPYTITTCMRSLVLSEVYDGSAPAWLLNVFTRHRKQGIVPLGPEETLLFLAVVCAVFLMIGARAISRRQILDPAIPE